MNESEFLQLWNNERPMYEAWGRFIVEKIKERLNPEIAPVSADVFIRLPPVPRLKADASLIDKAFYRNKPYEDPYNDITDKVGVRFVVLLTKDIKKVEDAITGCPLWTYSKDRDFEKEQEDNPLKFDYAAVHYVVRAKGDIAINSTTVTANSPCEIQVKTMLQHAYSELTHDTIYKPSIIATPSMRRSAAKSMALIEATNDYFLSVARAVEDATKPNRSLTTDFSSFYAEYVGRKPEVTRTESLILDIYGNKFTDKFIEDAKEFLKEREYISKSVSDLAGSKLLFRQPAILLVYYLASTHPSSTKENWPLLPEELRPIYVELGQSFDNQ